MEENSSKFLAPRANYSTLYSLPELNTENVVPRYWAYPAHFGSHTIDPGFDGLPELVFGQLTSLSSNYFSPNSTMEVPAILPPPFSTQGPVLLCRLTDTIEGTLGLDDTDRLVLIGTLRHLPLTSTSPIAAIDKLSPG